ncbi:MAG: hypothetical protein ABUK15_08795, partial [Anaerolineales bacterium]
QSIALLMRRLKVQVLPGSPNKPLTIPVKRFCLSGYVSMISVRPMLVYLVISGVGFLAGVGITLYRKKRGD